MVKSTDSFIDLCRQSLLLSEFFSVTFFLILFYRLSIKSTPPQDETRSNLTFTPANVIPL